MRSLKTQALLLALSGVTAWRCGVDDPVVGAHLHEIPAARVHQEYAEHELIDRARRLFTAQSYSDTASFVSIEDADAVGGTQPIRIVAIWDAVDTGDLSGTGSAPRQCSSVGQTIEARNAAGQWASWSGCKAEDIVTGVTGAARYTVMKQRTQDAMAKWAELVKIKPVRDDIVIDASVANLFGVPSSSRTVANADLVMIMTARPSPASPIAGFASCYQRDQRGRCTVGQFNWVPNIFNPSAANLPETVENELHTALHEVMHLLGGIGPGATPFDSTFLDASGAQRSTGVFQVEDDPVYPGSGKKRTLIVTPKVAAVAKRDFACDTAAGIPLEDVPLGKGSHWEARVMGSELMSYGTGSGQVYISDATLAFLEDTGQYIANYSLAGSLLGPQADDFKTLNSLKFLTTNEAPETYVPPPPLTPGALRWGRFQGCTFMDGAPATAWPAHYTCAKQQTYGCTPDNRMAAVCIVKDDYTSVESMPTCGEYRQDGSAARCDLANDNCDSNTGSCGIPSYMQYFASDADAAAASGSSGATRGNTGGFNNAMDYVPVRVGYWNCQYSKPATNDSGTLGGEGASLASLASFFGSATDMEKFGGQARCESCRCFESSLMDIGPRLNPAFPIYGLCYRANCYRTDYLQVAIRGQISGASFWYKCPAEGGKLYVPGYTGSIHCPVATEFCTQETITGVKYPEVDVVMEAAFWGTLMAMFVVVGMCCCCRCCRDRCIDCGKSACGARAWHEGSKDIDEDPDKHLPLQELPKCASWLLFIINLIGLLAGLAVFAVSAYGMAFSKAYSFGVTFLGMGFVLMISSLMGVCGSRTRARRGPSCWILTYFFLTVAVTVLMVWSATWNFVYAHFGELVNKYWDTVYDVIPAAYKVGTREEQVARATQLVETNFKAVSGLVVAACCLNLVCLLAAAAIIRFKVLVAMNIVVIGQMQIVFGIILTCTGFYLITAVETVGGTYNVVGVAIGAGLILLALGIFGIVGVFKKRVGLMVLYILLDIGAIAMCAGATYVFAYQSSIVTDYVAGLDDEAIGVIATSLHLPVTKQTLITRITTHLNQLALTSGVVMINLLVLLFSAIAFLLFLRAWKAGKSGVSAVAPAAAKPKNHLVRRVPGPAHS